MLYGGHETETAGKTRAHDDVSERDRVASGFPHFHEEGGEGGGHVRYRRMA